MSKIDKVATAFAVVHTQKQIERLEDKIFNVLEEVTFTEPKEESSLVRLLKGDKGDKGERGLKGDTGKTGAKGDAGKTGERGEMGATGSVGKQGERGETGPQGERGEKGDTAPAPDYSEQFEEALSKFNKTFSQNQQEINKSVNSQIRRLSGLAGGGGSYKIVDNADVDKAAITSLVDDAVLIYDPTKKKFVAQSFLSILDRLKADLEVQYDKLVDEEPDDGFTYVGEAVPGTTKGQSIWRIKRIYEFGADGDLDILWANGTADFDKTWNDRATYTYSAD